MKTKLNFLGKQFPYFVICFGILFNHNSNAQKIRKDYREMSTSERMIFRDAIIRLNNTSASNITAVPSTNTTLSPYNTGGMWDVFNDHHMNYAIHRQSLFLPWHRQFLLDLEGKMQEMDPNITIPYWDWDNDRTATSTIFWRNDLNFLSDFNLDWGLNRNTIPTYPDQGVSNIMANEQFARFYPRLEGAHDNMHGNIGGVMRDPMTSPQDPIFYLHHAFIDKLWQVWEDKENTSPTGPSTFSTPQWTGVSSMRGYTGQTNGVNTNGISVNPNSLINSRNIKVWYTTYNPATLQGFLSLEKYTSSGVENYNYKGEVRMGNDLNVPSGATCNIVTGSAVILGNGTYILPGSTFTASVNSTSFTRKAAFDEHNFLSSDLIQESLVVYPTITTGKVTISLKSKENYGSISVCDMLGNEVQTIVEGELNEDLYIIDISGLSAGMYFIKSQLNGQTITKKIILNK